MHFPLFYKPSQNADSPCKVWRSAWKRKTEASGSIETYYSVWEDYFPAKNIKNFTCCIKDLFVHRTAVVLLFVVKQNLFRRST